ncbi:MAG: hypothetical protein V3V00_10925 [Saprospiraceae bacterium]
MQGKLEKQGIQERCQVGKGVKEKENVGKTMEEEEPIIEFETI